MVDFKALKRDKPKSEVDPVFKSEGAGEVDEDVQAAIDEQLTFGAEKWKAKQRKRRPKEKGPREVATLPPLE